MVHVIRSYDPGFTESPPDLDIEGYYRSILSGRRAMLFLDDAADGDQLKRLVPPEGCILIVTSGRSFVLPGLRALILGPLVPEEAKEMANRIAPRLGSRAGELTALCGGIPVAIRKACDLLGERRDLTVNECMARLSRVDERRALVDLSVATAYDRLSPGLRRRWRWVSGFPGKFDAAGAAEIWGIDQEVAEDVLSQLLACFLVEWGGPDPGYAMNELFRLCADARCSEKERESIRRRMADHAVNLLMRANGLYQQGGEALRRGLALFDSQRLTIESGRQWMGARAGHEEWAARVYAGFPLIGSDILDVRQSPGDRLEWLQDSLAAARRINDRDREARLMNDAGAACHGIGDTKNAFDYHTRALGAAMETGDRRIESDALAGLGLAYARSGEFQHAVECLEKAVALSREIRDRRTECHALSEFARTRRMMGDAPGAMMLSEEALGLAGETGDLRAQARIMGDIAAGFLASGNARRAVEMGSQSLETAAGIGDRLQEGAALDTLGECFAVLGDSARSIGCYEARLKIVRELGDRYGEGDTLGNLGNACARAGDTRRALGYHQELLSLVRRLGDRRGEATVLGNIGKARARLGETRVAVGCHSERLLIARELGDRRLEGSALWNLSLALDVLGDRSQAISHAEAAQRIYESDGDAESAAVGRKISLWTEGVSHAHTVQADAARP
jgi:tetratricopeptide (TPR) repeat protein